MNISRRLVALALGSQLLLPALALAQQPAKSGPLATELAKLLDDHKLDSIAAKMADQYVGALYIPGSQLLVVKAKYAAPARMDGMLAQKAYRDAYIDLNSASDPKSKVFVSDLGANGLRPKHDRDQPSDTVDRAAGTTTFDGDWDKAKLSESEYMKRFQATDDEYSQMLQALIDALKKAS